MLPRFPRIRSRLLIGLAASLISASLFLPRSARSEWRTYTSADGLPDNRITAITEDRAGNLWFGSVGSATRFDGLNWKTFTYRDGLAGGDISAIKQDRSGNLWVAAVAGLSRFDGATWTTIFSDITIWQAIAEDRLGNLWFATGYVGGVSRFDGTNWRAFTAADGLANNTVYTVMADRSGNLWFGTGGGVSRFDGVTWTTFTAADGLAGNEVCAIAQDSTGNLWFGTLGYGVSRFDGSTWKTFTTADGLADNGPLSIAADRAGNVWFGFGEGGLGVSRYDGTRWRTFTTADGLAGNEVMAITTDHSGNLWFGTAYNGVSRFDGANWRTFTTGLPYLDTPNAPVAADSSGNLWVGAYGTGVARFDGASWRTYTTADGLASNSVNAIATDGSDDLWVGTVRGVSHLDGAGWSSLTAPNGDDVIAIAEARSGDLWCGLYGGSPDGVGRFDGTTWRTFTTADGLANDYVSTITEDLSGNLWFAFVLALGVSRFDGTNWRTFTTSDGLASDNVRQITADHTGKLWFATDAGLSCFNGAGWRTFTIADGLAGNDVRAILEDRSGHLWIGTTNGLSLFDESTSWRTFTSADGLGGHNVYKISIDHLGNLWFLTEGGLTRYEPDRVPPRTILLSSPPLLSGSQSQSAAFVAALGEQGVQFSSRLDGGPWSPWETAGRWTQFGIPDGMHTLEARCRDNFNNVENTPAIATFEVDATPPAPIIASPLFAQPVRGAVEIRGTAADARFRQYRIDVRPAGAASWDPPAATTLIQSAMPVTDGTLASWNTSSLPDGNYELRLVVSDSLGLTGVAQVSVIVDNHAPYADVTAPARVSAASGGHVFTTNSELNLYFPPHAFLQDALVVIAPSTSAPDTLLSGAARVLPAYDLSWGSSSLRKPATLEFSSAGRQPAPGALAIYFSSDGITWQRLGGTAEPQKVSLTVENPGRYALFSEKSLWSGSGHLSSLSLTPRVFSVANRFADDQVAIGFSLGRAAPVTVRIYNRAGRLVRSLVEGEPMGAGENLVRWNGTDRADVRVADGIYLVTVEALGETRRNTIAVVR